MTRIAEIQNYQSAYGEDPNFLHLEDGKRVEFAAKIVEEVMIEAGTASFDRGATTLRDSFHLPFCPGCAVTLSFNLGNILGKENGHDPKLVAQAMLRLWGEVLETGEFFTTERSGMQRSNEETSA